MSARWSSDLDVVAVRPGSSAMPIERLDRERQPCRPRRARASASADALERRARRPRRADGLGQQHAELVAAEARDGVGRRAARRGTRRPTSGSSTSPAWWPSVSLTSLKWSRSISITATRRRCARRLADAPARSARGTACGWAGPVSASCSAWCWFSSDCRIERLLGELALGDVLDHREHEARLPLGVALERRPCSAPTSTLPSLRL